MRNESRILLIAVLVAVIIISLMVASGTTATEYKMTTPIAPAVATPDKLETSIGTLNMNDGTPDTTTIQKIYDNLDRSRALQAYLLAIPISGFVLSGQR